MRKVIVGLLIVFVLFMLAGAMFGAGFAVARVTQPNPLPSTITTPPVATTPLAPGAPTTSPPASDELLDYALLNEILTLLDAQFYGEIPDSETLTYGAIRGLLLTLDDPNTAFIEPNTARILAEDATGQFEGIGAWVQMRPDGYLEVSRPMPGQPAEAVGVLAGDIILTVDGEELLGKGLYEMLTLIRGPRDTQVTLEIGRQGEVDPLTFVITRARIEIPVVEYEMLDEGIAYIRLTEFDATASNRVQNALTELLAQNPSGLIFDLRDNPGGYLNEAIAVADLFLEEGLVLIERDSSGGVRRFSSYNGDMAEQISLVVLVNGGSASASEIVAGAIQDRERAPLMGELTFGKGSVQMPYNLTNGSQFRVTIARWYTPNDNTIHGAGLTPDIEVEFPSDTPAEEDPQLQQAIDYLLSED